MNKEYKFVLHTRVYWERHQNKKRMTQCHRCQKWGHAASNCCMPAVCLKCADPHITNECRKPRDTPAKCANCGEPHPANSINCAIYIKKMEDRASRVQKMRKQPPPPTVRPESFVDAPVPSRNAWTERANAMRSVQPVAAYVAPTSTHYPAINNPIPIANPTVQSVPSNVQSNDSINDINILFSEMNKLNGLVNIKNIIIALKDLKKMLTSAREESEKFMIFVNFSQDLKKYGI